MVQRRQKRTVIQIPTLMATARRKVELKQQIQSEVRVRTKEEIVSDAQALEKRTNSAKN
jgi:hypothetical protein